ncbi:hypothetical protein E2320_017969, partial [Naja naja]
MLASQPPALVHTVCGARRAGPGPARRSASGLPMNTVVLFVPQQEAWVVERMGRFHRILEPGLNFLIPLLDRIRYVQSLKEIVINVPEQSAITHDNVTLQIDGVLYLRIMDPYKASYGVEDPEYAVTQLAQTTMRSELGKLSLDKVFRERESLNASIVYAINQASDYWGIRCLRYEIKDIHVPPRVKESMQMQVEAERRKRATVLESEGIRESAINVAEGKKQAQILASEAEKRERINQASGDASAILVKAQAKAEAIGLLSMALTQQNGNMAASLSVAEQYVQAFSQLAKESNTILLPTSTGDVTSMVAQAMSIYSSLNKRVRLRAQGRGMGRRAAAAGLAWAALLPCAALALFAGGFLLMRLELGQRSACHLPPGRAPTSPAGASSSSSCWLPAAARFPRAVLVLIDALRFDFAAWPRTDRRPGARPPRPFEGHLESLRRLALRQPRHGRLYRFRADPPSTTMQRLKALTTGSLPTFVDAGSNFASYAIREDNLLWQLASNGRKVVFMGDDTWEGLFPQAFHQAHFFPSFNVKDLHTVDDGILQHLYQTVDGGEWDLLIAHFLGVDHCGHKHGPDHPEMAKKLSQMNEMLSSLVDHLGNDTLLLVAGDHGMTATGDHGGDSDEELDAALFVYSKAPLFQEPPPEEPQTVPQVNLVPTLALLLGVPVPYSNIGEVMADLFATEGDAAASLQAAQDLPAEKLRHLQGLFRSAVEEHERLSAQEASLALLLRMEGLRRRFQQYLREARAVCAESWARFHPGCMVAGCALLTSSCLLCYMASRLAPRLDFSYRHAFLYPLLWGLPCWGWLTSSGGPQPDVLLLCAWGAAASQLGFFWHCWARRPPVLRGAGLCPPFEGLRLRPGLWVGPGLSLGILSLRCAAMLSDSFVVAEGQVVPFLLTSLVLLEALRLQWKGRLDGSLLCWQLLAALGGVVLCARLSGLFRKCREETPACQTASILGPLSSVQEPRAKNLYYGLCLGVLGSLVWGTRCWLRHYGNLNSPCALVLFVRWGFPLLALALAGFWAITSGAEEALVKRHTWARLALEAFPRGIYALVVAGLLLVWWKPVTVFLESSQEAPLVSSTSEALIPQLYRRMQASLKSRLEEAPGGCRATVAAYGLGSVYSAALLIALALLAFLLMTLHTERLSLAFLLLFVEAFALLWMQACTRALSAAASSSSSSAHSDPFEVPWEALVAWALAAAQFFYATGHQPVFPAIHWNAAFMGFQQGHTTNLLPALLVGANTFASQILLAAGCPLLLLWPFVCEASTSGARRPKAQLQDRAEEPMMEMRLREAPERFSAALLQLGLRYLLVLGLQLLASVLAAMILRRHLMVWKVFAPKFIFEAVGFVVSCVSLLLGLGLVMRVDCAVSKWFKQITQQRKGAHGGASSGGGGGVLAGPPEMRSASCRCPGAERGQPWVQHMNGGELQWSGPDLPRSGKRFRMKPRRTPGPCAPACWLQASFGEQPGGSPFPLGNPGGSSNCLQRRLCSRAAGRRFGSPGQCIPGPDGTEQCSPTGPSSGQGARLLLWLRGSEAEGQAWRLNGQVSEDRCCCHVGLLDSGSGFCVRLFGIK